MTKFLPAFTARSVRCRIGQCISPARTIRTLGSASQSLVAAIACWIETGHAMIHRLTQRRRKPGGSPRKSDGLNAGKTFL